MWETRRNKRFTPEEMKQLSANPFTYRVSTCQISYTLEFKNLFLARYEAGEGVREIFESAGYDTEVLGSSRIYCFVHQLVKQAEAGPSTKQEKPVHVDYSQTS